MRTERTTKERRIHRDGMDKYVFEPSRDYAASFGLIGFGVGVCIFAVWADHFVLTPTAFIISTTAIFAGVGWAQMIRQRLTDYYFDIMQERYLDESVMTEHDDELTIPRRIPNGRGEVIVELEKGSGLDNADWKKLATAVLVSKLPISKNALNKANVISQPKYKLFYDYMMKEGYMQYDKNTNKLTNDGIDFLANYLPTPQPYTRLGANGS